MRARKRFAQHFLERAWVAKLVEVVEPDAADDVVEIGPGRGAVTLPLAAAVRRLLAVEVDRDLAAALGARNLANVTIITGDILELDLPSVIAGWLGEPAGPAAPVRVVGNLPYNISSPILFTLLDLAQRTGGLRDATLMLQKEVADRLVARPGTGEYGVLTVLTAVGAEVRRLLSLPPGAFRPAPRVSSAVVRLDFRPSPVPLADVETFTRMVRTMFTQRRKTVLNALRPFAGSRGRDAAEALRQAGIAASRRPETLQLPELARLADALADGRDQAAP